MTTKFEKGSIHILSFETLLKKDIINWKHNRPPDDKRVSEIAEGILTNKQCDGTIYVAKLDQDLVCYDGIHRHEAIKLLLQRREPVSDIPIVVFVLKEATHGKILDHFSILNNCIPVPELYTQQQQQPCGKIKIIETVVNYYRLKFPNFFSTSRSPRVPNENKDIFTDKLSEIYDKLLPHNSDIFINRLNDQNLSYRKNFLESKPTSRNLRKCINFEFYLFFKRDWHKL